MIPPRASGEGAFLHIARHWWSYTPAHFVSCPRSADSVYRLSTDRLGREAYDWGQQKGQQFGHGHKADISTSQAAAEHIRCNTGSSIGRHTAA